MEYKSDLGNSNLHGGTTPNSPMYLHLVHMEVILSCSDPPNTESPSATSQKAIYK